MPAPTLHTERLTLRPQIMDDFATLRDFYATERSKTVGGPIKPTQLWYGFAADTGCWELQGFGAWAITRKSDNAFIGRINLNGPPNFPEREIGWSLFDGYEGHGYAQEAATAARNCLFETLGWKTAVSYIDPDNARSIKLAETLGATLDEAAYGSFPAYPDTLVYRHPAPEARI